jgi:phosphate transport system permease protein
MVSRAFGAALVLAILVIVLFTIARLLGGSAPGQLSARQRRKLADADPLPAGFPKENQV